jgi:hypothetical protein
MSLGTQDRKNLIDRLIPTPDDNESFLLKIRQRMERSALPQVSALEVVRMKLKPY